MDRDKNTRVLDKEKNRKYAAVPADDPSVKNTNGAPVPKQNEEKPAGDPSEGQELWTTKKILKNLLVVSTAFFLLFTAFMGLSNLQSSINCDAGLGVASLAIVYATITFSALFLPSLLIQRFGIKWTLVASMIGYTSYSASNFYPTWFTVIPTAVLLGLAGAPLWASKSTYLTTIGIMYAKVRKEKRDGVVSRFFGIFFLFFQASQVLGNLISSLVFSYQETNYNATKTDFACGSIKAGMCLSGGSSANSTDMCKETKPPQDLVNIVTAIYTACGITAVIILVLFMDPIKQSIKNKQRSTSELVGATLGLMLDKRLLLLIPFTMYNGLEQAFIQGDFTKSFVTCKVGVQWVGVVMICYGVVDATTSFFSGRIEKHTGRIPQFTFAAIINVTLMLVMIIWKPTDDLPVYFVIAGLWGFTDAIWQTQMNAYFGVLFPFNQEPAFSNYRLWQSAGFTLSFAYSSFFCLWTKCLMLTIFLCIGMTGYYITELQRKTKTPWASLKRRSSSISSSFRKISARWKKPPEEELHVGNYLGPGPVDQIFLE